MLPYDKPVRHLSTGRSHTCLICILCQRCFGRHVAFISWGVPMRALSCAMMALALEMPNICGGSIPPPVPGDFGDWFGGRLRTGCSVILSFSLCGEIYDCFSGGDREPSAA